MEYIYILNIILFYYIYNLCPSFGGRVFVTTQSSNSTINDGNNNDTDDPLADDVDWISALGGCVIVLTIAACYAIYVMNRRRKELKKKEKEQQFSLMMSSREHDHNIQGQQTHIDDFVK